MPKPGAQSEFFAPIEEQLHAQTNAHDSFARRDGFQNRFDEFAFAQVFHGVPKGANAG